LNRDKHQADEFMRRAPLREKGRGSTNREVGCKGKEFEQDLATDRKRREWGKNANIRENTRQKVGGDSRGAGGPARNGGSRSQEALS